MAIIKPDYSDTNQGGGIIPAGIYVCTICKCDVDSKRPDGTRQITWELCISEGHYTGRKFLHGTPVEGQYAFAAQVFCQAVNTSYTNEAIDTDDYIGKKIEVETVVAKDKNGNDSKYPRVKRILPYIEKNTVEIPENFNGQF